MFLFPFVSVILWGHLFIFLIELLIFCFNLVIFFQISFMNLNPFFWGVCSLWWVLRSNVYCIVCCIVAESKHYIHFKLCFRDFLIIYLFLCTCSVYTGWFLRNMNPCMGNFWLWIFPQKKIKRLETIDGVGVYINHRTLAISGQLLLLDLV